MKELETDIQKSLVKWLNYFYPDVEFFHIANGQKREGFIAKQLQSMGVKAGVSDLFFPDLRLWVELKRKTGRLSIEQTLFLERRKKSGDHVVVPHGFEDAKIKLKPYLERYIHTGFSVDENEKVTVKTWKSHKIDERASRPKTN